MLISNMNHSKFRLSSDVVHADAWKSVQHRGMGTRVCARVARRPGIKMAKFSAEEAEYLDENMTQVPPAKPCPKNQNLAAQTSIWPPWCWSLSHHKICIAVCTTCTMLLVTKAECKHSCSLGLSFLRPSSSLFPQSLSLLPFLSPMTPGCGGHHRIALSMCNNFLSK